MTSPAGTILLVEDNEDDVFIFTRAYKQAHLAHPVQVARDGQEALQYISGEEKFADRTAHPPPFLVFLDLKLPLKPGLEVLERVRAKPDLADLAVVILTSSAEARDILRAYELGAQAFLVKPPSASMLAAAIGAAEKRAASRAAPWQKIPGDMFDVALA